MKRTFLQWTLAAALCSCSGNHLVGSRFVKSVPVTASQGATIVLAASDEPALAGTVLTIPPNALAQNTVITIDLGEKDVVSGANQKAAGPVAIWGPAGTVFSKPVTMTLPFKLPSGATSTQLFVDVWEENGQHTTVPHWKIQKIESKSGLLTFAVNGFTTFQAGTESSTACRSDTDCQSGQVCINGACEDAQDGGPADGGVICICPSGEYCDSNGNCQPDPNQCGSNSDCQAGQVCIGGFCEVACASNSDCPNGGVCLNGVCSACTDPVNGCADGGVPSCRSNSDCPVGEYCDPTTNTCQGAVDAGCYDANGNPCDGGTACGLQNQPCCSNGGCAQGLTCDSSTGVCEASDGGIACDPNRGCPSGYVCDANGTCQPVDGGQPDGGCGDPGNPCDGGSPDGGPSDAGVACVAGTNCLNGTECGAGGTCVNGTCQCACDPSTCPTGCCDSSGLCQPGTANNACGIRAQACVTCGATQSCVNAICQ
jgi:Cys-rich repeat protein